MIDVVQTRDTFDRAIAQDHEAVHLRQQLEVLRHETGVAREDLLSLRARHQAEAADVERLEGFGLTAVLAAVRGTRTGTAPDNEDNVRFPARHGIRSYNEVVPHGQPPQAYERMLAGDARFRMVLDAHA